MLFFVFLFTALSAIAADRVSLAVAPSSETNKRNSEADLLALADGRLMLVWTEFYTSQGSDWGSARLAAIFSRDGGKTWAGKTVLQENIGTMNVMEPDLLRLRSGKVLFAFVRKNSEGDCAPMLRISTDRGKTFSAPKPIPISPSPSYTGSNNDRMIQLKSGRVLLPLWYTPDYRVDRHIKTRVYYSDDEGATWKQSKTLVDLPDSPSGAQEPGVVELKDGSVLMWMRTDKGFIYRSISRDGGETWSQPESMGVQSPRSPQSIKRIPSTGDLLLVWNNSPKLRTPLSAAISKDEGKTWANIHDLDLTPDTTFAYTSIEFVKNRVLLSYYAARGSGLSLQFQSIPVRWFYQ